MMSHQPTAAVTLSDTHGAGQVWRGCWTFVPCRGKHQKGSHSFIRSFFHSFIHSFIHSLIHSLIHSRIHSLTHSIIHSFVLWFDGRLLLMTITNAVVSCFCQSSYSVVFTGNLPPSTGLYRPCTLSFTLSSILFALSVLIKRTTSHQVCCHTTLWNLTGQLYSFTAKVKEY